MIFNPDPYNTSLPYINCWLIPLICILNLIKTFFRPRPEFDQILISNFSFRVRMCMVSLHLPFLIDQANSTYH